MPETNSIANEEAIFTIPKYKLIEECFGNEIEKYLEPNGDTQQGTRWQLIFLIALGSTI